MAAPLHDQSATYFRKGFGLKADVQSELSADYNGRLVDALRENDYTLTVGDVTIRLAKEFGFCYGVERAVEYAYQTRRKFPDRRLLLVGEIIHNPHVNEKLRAMGIQILEPDASGAFDFSVVRPDDVVILPAFGVTIAAFEALRAIGCVLVDTTCGSVLNVWKRVEAYARDGFTALIHGKYYHEETRATASQVMKHPAGSYLVVRDMGEAREVCDYIEGRGDRAAFLAKYGKAASPGFDPDVHLRRIGVANQTTMLAKESLAIGEEVGQAMARARGAEVRATDFRTFDTICSATQERQDAVMALLEEPLDVMVVIGGFNSSNTISLAALCAERVPTYHIEDAAGIDPEAGTVHYRVAGVKHVENTLGGWLPSGRPVRVGLTAGASTPNNKIGETVARILATRGLALAPTG
ncbi:MAG: 4-hydroxy-3-methylbut-2-enyl diphosphate reductase [Gemmatimonadaceae bacterium]|nr:4-hydroxy-3-methylbut-2-enyl diphosphate reductase [Gemmatimonadaceae bacterium]NUR35440.1 4-hydroxy-3-methylbut-2-enyl diphosphate reductase [Gemmatimonadaceae bacterium]